MRRAVIVLIITLTCALAITWLGTSQVVRISQERVPDAMEALEAASAGDYALAYERMKALEDSWIEDHSWLKFFLDHRNLDNIQSTMISATTACSMEDSQAIIYCSVLADLFEHLPDANMLGWGNFF